VAQAGQQSLLPDFVAPLRRGLASGFKGAFDVGGALLGFMVLAVLLGAGDPDGAALVLFGVLAVSAVSGLLLLARVRHSSAPGGASTLRLEASVDKRPQLARIVVARFLFLLGVYVVGRFMFLFVADGWSLTPEAAVEQAGMALATLAALTVAASVPMGWLADRVGQRPVMAAGGALAATGIVAVPLTSNVTQLVAAGVLLALGTAAFGAASWATLTNVVAPERSGWQLGLGNLATAGAGAVAGLFGPIIDSGNALVPHAGYFVAFSLAAIAALIGGLICWRPNVRGSVPERVTTPMEAR
jgi:Na+/melibiose symporter-like transporter